MALTSYISFRRLSYFWNKVKLYIDNKISEIVQPEGDKEILHVLTYSSSAPASANPGDLYINSAQNKLYIYDNGWVETIASMDFVYIADDTAHMYLYTTEGTFSDVSGEMIDTTIYVNNLDTDLEDYTDPGLYTVYYSHSNAVDIYTLVISKFQKRSPGPTPHHAPRLTTVWVQNLSNESCYMIRQKEGATSSWESWTTHTYAYTEDIMPLIYAGL